MNFFLKKVELTVRYIVAFSILFWFIFDYKPNYLNYLVSNKILIFNYLVVISCLMIGLILIFFVINKNIAIKLSFLFSVCVLLFSSICVQFLF